MKICYENPYGYNVLTKKDANLTTYSFCICVGIKIKKRKFFILGQNDWWLVGCYTTDMVL